MDSCSSPQQRGAPPGAIRFGRVLILIEDQCFEVVGGNEVTPVKSLHPVFRGHCLMADFEVPDFSRAQDGQIDRNVRESGVALDCEPGYGLRPGNGHRGGSQPPGDPLN